MGYVYKEVLTVAKKNLNQYEKDFDNKILSVSAGDSHIAYVTNDGKAGTWGIMKFNQSGSLDNILTNEGKTITKSMVKEFKPQEGVWETADIIPEFYIKYTTEIENTQKTETNGIYSVALTNNGDLYVWSINPTNEEIGTVNKDSNYFSGEFLAHKLDNISNIKDVCIGFTEIEHDENHKYSPPRIYQLIAIKNDGTVWNVDTEVTQIFDLSK